MKNKLFVFAIILAFVFGAPVSNAQQEDVLLESIGVFSAQSVYLTYIAVGVMADAYGNKMYEKEFVQNSLSTYANLSSAAMGQLDKLASSGALTADDKNFVRSLKETYGLLGSEIKGYLAYMDSNSDSDFNLYDNSRVKAWENIKKLLGL